MSTKRSDTAARWLGPEEEHAWRVYRRMVTVVQARTAQDLAELGLSEPDYEVLSTLSERSDGSGTCVSRQPRWSGPEAACPATPHAWRRVGSSAVRRTRMTAEVVCWFSPRWDWILSSKPLLLMSRQCGVTSSTSSTPKSSQFSAVSPPNLPASRRIPVGPRVAGPPRSSAASRGRPQPADDLLRFLVRGVSLPRTGTPARACLLDRLQAGAFAGGSWWCRQGSARRRPLERRGGPPQGPWYARPPEPGESRHRR